ncbi:MAG: SCO family protein [Acidobacteriaceae bacterium]
MKTIFGPTKRSAFSIGVYLLVIAVPCICVSGCHSSAKGKDASSAVSSASPSAAKQYSVRGKVISADAKDGVISLDTDAIPGFMEAMSMAYTLQDPSVASELHPGDTIAAQLHLGAQGAVLSDIVIIKQAVLNVKPTVQYHVPQPGDLVPDFAFLNQSGHKIDFRQFRGKVLVLTFIYTRCAFSKYCPLMSRNFAKLDTMLAADPKLYSRTHLLSISFDPKYDTPAVLRSYGGAYTGRYTKENFQHWGFAAPKQKELASVLQWFDVGVTSADGKVLQHTLSTVVVGPDGRVRYFYPTNTWTAQQLFQDVQRVLATSGPDGGAKR